MIQTRYVLVALLLVTSRASAMAEVQTASDGRRIRHDDRKMVLVGDSGTQCVLQNLNIDYRAWIDDCAEAHLNAIHLWSFVAPRQSQDGKVIESRYGYVYPGVTPWAKHPGGPLARDGLPQWNLCEFDEGDDPDQNYWPRLRDLCGYAAQKNLLVGITVFFGWPKHQVDWAYHPFNVVNGGHLSDDRPIIEAVQRIATPGTEVLRQRWSHSWDPARKTQWVWERFAEKLLEETQPFGNTFYVFMDERSYSDGNCGDHFAEFFQRRKAFWIDGELRRNSVDAVVVGTGPGRNINKISANALGRQPARPFFEFELPPYRGAEVRHNLYACVLGGGHYFLHNDQDQETPTTGIMSYDPRVKNSRHGAVRDRLRWLGIACRVLNDPASHTSEMLPHNDVIVDGEGYCLAAAGSRYVAYLRSGGRATLRLHCSPDSFDVKAINPRTGSAARLDTSIQGNDVRLVFPDREDWIVVAQLRESVTQPTP